MLVCHLNWGCFLPRGKADTLAKVKLSELYNRVLENLLHSTPESKKLAFDALDIRVYASPDTTEIRGVIPLELDLPTTEQTWGCLPFHAYVA